jgi:Uma2 family endonuclease
MPMATARKNTKRWTLAELHSLPDDGNKYELVRGELFVTPAPTNEHEEILARLTRILDPYVAAHDLGLVFHPRAVVRFRGSEVEPDLMVRQPAPRPRTPWERMPKASLVVEVISPTTRRRDRGPKREFYLEADVAEYWIIDPERRSIAVVRLGEADREVRDKLVWQPRGAASSLDVPVAELFG